MTDQYGVVGNPVTHSKSPWIHAEFARLTGEDIVYERILSPLGGLEAAVNGFWRAGGVGLNVTVPFKREAVLLADRLTSRAAIARAVNTLRAVPCEGPGPLSRQMEVIGDNTDGVGLVRDVRDNLGRTILDKRILILGAGGAARGIIADIAAERPAQIWIANRTPSGAHELVREMHPLLEGISLSASAFAEVPASAFDIVINATSSGLSGNPLDVPERCFDDTTLAYDLMYGAKPSMFLQRAESRRAQTADGLGMLVEQAAEAFWVWRGIRPDSGPMLAALRADNA